ncbi:hypothetical protein M2R47_04845 [Moraxella sp. Tifton1]|uniref:hypothetical protein n=1 Tax=Moraxella oculi TaxID=2940516 RepID=UPI002010C753|nr:hypothetical protein [Moraxella sp. Tifton1]MCL1623572.1 hypothetical protein [Moraxella sp. Tifton1]
MEFYPHGKSIMLAHAGAVRCWWSVRSVLVLIFVDGYIWAVGLVFACWFLSSTQPHLYKDKFKNTPLKVC